MIKIPSWLHLQTSADTVHDPRNQPNACYTPSHIHVAIAKVNL